MMRARICKVCRRLGATMHGPPNARRAPGDTDARNQLMSKQHYSDDNLTTTAGSFKPVGMVARIVLARIMTRVMRQAASNRPRSAVRQCTPLTCEARP